MSPRIIGIDPSMTATGLALADGKTATISTNVKDGDRRLAAIFDAVAGELLEVDLAVVEDLPRNAMGAGVTGLAHGVIRLALLRDDVPYLRVPAATLKVFATGKGNATKPDMRVELLKRTGLDLRDDNQVDAAWLRFLGLELAGFGEIPLPMTHIRATAKLTLPETYEYEMTSAEWCDRYGHTFFDGGEVPNIGAHLCTNCEQEYGNVVGAELAGEVTS